MRPVQHPERPVQHLDPAGPCGPSAGGCTDGLDALKQIMSAGQLRHPRRLAAATFLCVQAAMFAAQPAVCPVYLDWLLSITTLKRSVRLLSSAYDGGPPRPVVLPAVTEPRWDGEFAGHQLAVAADISMSMTRTASYARRFTPGSAADDAAAICADAGFFASQAETWPAYVGWLADMTGLMPPPQLGPSCGCLHPPSAPDKEARAHQIQAAAMLAGWSGDGLDSRMLAGLPKISVRPVA